MKRCLVEQRSGRILCQYSQTYFMQYLRTPLILLILMAGGSCKKHHDMAPDPIPLPKKVVVTTIAGDGNDGYKNGAALSAEFESPTDVAVSSDGTIYISDYNNHRVRKLAGGQVTTLAGNNTFGFLNGHGEDAQFQDPYRLVTDAAGNCYLLDQVDARVRRISPGADVVTYAGRPSSGFVDGDTSIAKMQVNANGEAIDQQGNIYIGDTFNGRIRKITTTGQISTLAGDGTRGYMEGDPKTAKFTFPGGVAVDKQGNVYVSDQGNFRIRKVTPAGQVSTFAGSGVQGDADGDATTAQFKELVDIVVDGQGNVYLGQAHAIRKITPQGVVTTIAGGTPGYADGAGADARFGYINGLGIDAQGNLYVADGSNRIRKVSFE